MTTITPRPAPTPRHGFTATAAILAVLALAAPSTPATAGHNTEADVPPPCGPLAVNQPIQLPAGTTAAGPILRRLAAHLRAEPADTQNGRYTHVAVTVTAADSSIGDCVTTETRHAAEQRWRDERANSGRITGTPWYSNPGPAPEMVTTWYRPGDLPGLLPGYAPSDPAVLAAALDEAYPPDTDRLAAKVRAVTARAGIRATAGAASRVEAIGALTAWHHTPLPVRRAILRVLADVPGLTYHPRVTLAGWTGIAVSVPARQNTVRHVLLLDAATGQVRGAEYVLTDPTIGRNLAVEVPYSIARTVMAPQARTNQATPASQPIQAG
ncbi:hypothetical protein [Actinoplanes sp. ATCC 53533]|uniref:hypothetical protein n=1 Tax=Actinoplanes sp. ATCC 53533 TaxID=1288362 RepID=UPI000F77D061|nr:hypothetical protein [Actinoplanes sp. ATCC 53533]